MQWTKGFAAAIRLFQFLKQEIPMGRIEFEGRTLEIDEEGFLVNFEAWDEEVAIELARREGIILTGRHWEVIRFLRDYYDEFRVSPAIRLLTKIIGKRLRSVENSDVKFLYELFPDGPAKQACKVSGLPKPTGCL